MIKDEILLYIITFCIICGFLFFFIYSLYICFNAYCRYNKEPKIHNNYTDIK